MLKTIAWISLGRRSLLGTPIGSCADGYGVKLGASSTSTFDRSWNRANESKDRATATTICITTTLSARTGLCARTRASFAAAGLDSAPANPIERRRPLGAAVAP